MDRHRYRGLAPGGDALFSAHMNIHENDALTLSGMLDAGTISAVELMRATLERIAAVNGTVNAVVSLRDGDALMAEAQAADVGPRKGWLHGIPMAIKDLSDAAGLPTSMGSPLFAGQIAAQDDIMVARLKQAGAIIIGKTNTPEFGLGSHTFNPVHGSTRNPYDTTRSAGGSSGGAAAALSARMLCVADGSDMMGSLRNPAGWNNVYGMRPSWGVVPSEPNGDVFLHQLATAGPMARTPGDLAALLDTMSGPDPRQPHGVAIADTLPLLSRDLARLRLGWLGDWQGAIPFEDGIIQLSEMALGQMEELGHQVAHLAAPFEATAIWDSWITLRSFSVAAGLAEIWQDPDRARFLKKDAQWEIERGLSLDASALQRASVVRSQWFGAAHALFADVDVLVLPSAQLWPFDVDMVHPTEIAGVKMDTYHRWMEVVVPAALLGLPVVNVPIGFGDNGLPAGLQLIGPRGSDAKLLQLAQDWHQATAWPQEHPPVIATTASG